MFLLYQKIANPGVFWRKEQDSIRKTISCFLSASQDAWRKGQDSNLRYFRMLVFKTSALNHSATLPCTIIPQNKKLAKFPIMLYNKSSGILTTNKGGESS